MGTGGWGTSGSVGPTKGVNVPDEERSPGVPAPALLSRHVPGVAGTHGPWMTEVGASPRVEVTGTRIKVVLPPTLWVGRPCDLYGVRPPGILDGSSGTEPEDGGALRRLNVPVRQVYV